MKNGKRKLTEKTIKQLNKMGMIWSLPENRWMVGFLECYQYFKKNGNLNAPRDYRSKSGVELNYIIGLEITELLKEMENFHKRRSLN